MAYIDYYFNLVSVKTNCLKSMAILGMENAHYKLQLKTTKLNNLCAFT